MSSPLIKYSFFFLVNAFLSLWSNFPSVRNAAFSFLTRFQSCLSRLSGKNAPNYEMGFHNESPAIYRKHNKHRMFHGKLFMGHGTYWVTALSTGPRISRLLMALLKFLMQRNARNEPKMEIAWGKKGGPNKTEKQKQSHFGLNPTFIWRFCRGKRLRIVSHE